AEDGIRGFHVTGVQTCALPICFERPPLGFRSLMPWDEVVGLSDDVLKRYEEHRRLIRIVTTPRLREEVSQRAEVLLLPLLGGSTDRQSVVQGTSERHCRRLAGK